MIAVAGYTKGKSSISVRLAAGKLLILNIWVIASLTNFPAHSLLRPWSKSWALGPLVFIPATWLQTGIVFLGWGGRGAAINDVSIADSMTPSSHDWENWYEPRGLLPEEGPTMMRSLGEILAGDLG